MWNLMTRTVVFRRRNLARTLALAGVVVSSVLQAADGWPQTTPAQGATLKARLAPIEQQVAERRSSLALVRGVEVSTGMHVEVVPPGNLEQGFRAESVHAMFDATSQELSGALAGAEYTGLRACVARDVSTIRQALKSIEVRTESSPITEGSTVTIVTEKSTDGAVNALRRMLAKYRKLSRLAVTFAVASQPTGARFQLSFLTGEPVRNTTTDSTLGNVYRGCYSYSVQLAGYKEVTGTVDLVNEVGRALTCRLNRVDEAAGPLPCRWQ
jgi:hypothetical protein